MKNRGPYTTKCTTIEIKSGARWKMFLSGAAAAMNVALKMKNLFNNACTFHHKSYVIFSFFFSAGSFLVPSFSFDAVSVFGGAIDCWCEYSRTLATGWSVHTSTNFAYPSIAIYCRHSHSASLHLARTSSESTHTHTHWHTHLRHSVNRVFGSVDYTANTVLRSNRTSVVLHAYSSNLYIWEKFSIYHRRTDKLYSDENGLERKLNQTRLKKKIRNKITKKSTEHEIKIIERKCSCTRRADEQMRERER